MSLQDHAHNNIIKSLPPSAERLPLFIVGDVHGCARELSDLLRKARERVARFQLVLVGDLFTKGPDPVGVFEQIQEHGAICIKGNHDWALWASILQAQKRGLNSLPEHTRQTLHLIRYHRRAIFDHLATLPHAYTTRVTPGMKRGAWEADYPLIIVHAGIDPTRGLEATSERMLLTARYVRWDGVEPPRKLLLVPSGHRAEVLQSLAPQTVVQGNGADGDTLAQAKVFQPRPADGKFRWHELHQGPELIVFGHDAKQGLFRKTLASGRPICVGIDTGCTYGRALTGYFPEFDDAIQMPARRTYFDILKNVILIRSPHPRVAV